jgi:hypothetical protein
MDRWALPDRDTGIPMSGLNDHHKSHLRITFAHVDELLSKALRELDPARAESPFGRRVPDAAPVQRKVAADYAARVRAAMRSLLDRYGIELPRRKTWKY